MANSYFRSENIRVFPCAYRGTTGDGTDINYMARVPSEYNLTRNISYFNDNVGYIISAEYGDGFMEVVIGGYYFYIKADYEDYEGEWLCIKPSKLRIDSELQEQVLFPIEGDSLTTLDLDGEFKGLAVADEAMASCLCLKLEDKNKYAIKYTNILSEDNTNYITGNLISSSTNKGFAVTNKSNSFNGKEAYLIGNNLKANNDGSTLIGKYNKAEDGIFIVGCGTADVTANRKNALVIDNNGNISTIAKITDVNGMEATGEIKAENFYATSDIRLKENITEYVPEKSILDLPIKKYDFIDGAKNQIGCIAQDLQEICPELVKENNDGYFTIQESKLVYLLLDEVKKLKKEVEDLKASK